MSRINFGPKVFDRTQHLLERILAYANNDIDDINISPNNLAVNWQTDEQLMVKTKLRYLEQLTAQNGKKLTKEQIRESLQRLKDVKILEDHRLQPQGSDIWHFTLKLSRKDTAKNINKFTELWQAFKGSTSDFQHSDSTSTMVRLRSPTALSTSLSAPLSPTDVRQSLPKRYCNLPPQTYQELIGRQTELQELLKQLSLEKRNPIVTVNGIGGVGKTALVLEAAYQIWEAKHSPEPPPEIPIFEAIIFISAKDTYLLPTGIISRLQKQQNLQDIFRCIATTLDHPAITQASIEEQISVVNQALERQKTLLIIDNLETLSLEAQHEIIAFLFDLPATVKSIVSTRKSAIIYSQITLESLSEADSYKLIAQAATNKGLNLTEPQKRELYRRCEGVPIALIYTIGRLAMGYNLEPITDSEITYLPEDIGAFCFADIVSSLQGKPAHKLLMSLAIFAQPPIKKAWLDVAQLESYRQSVIDANIAELYQLSLVTSHNERYQMLGITREYAKTELAQVPTFAKEVRERWVKWYCQYTKNYGNEDWGEWHIQFDYLQAEWINILAVLSWCGAEERYQDVQELWRNVNNFANFYGYWDDRLFWLDWLLERAERCADYATLVENLSHKGYTLLVQGGQENWEASDRLLTKAWELQEYGSLRLKRAIANNIGNLRLAQENYAEAHHWLDISQGIINDQDYPDKLKMRDLMGVIYFKGQVYYHQGSLKKACEYFEEGLQGAQKINWQREANYCQYWLAEIAIDLGNFGEAENLLRKGLPVAEKNNAKRRIAYYQAAWARLEKQRGNQEVSEEWRRLAIEGFQRLGMRKELENMC